MPAGKTTRLAYPFRRYRSADYLRSDAEVAEYKQSVVIEMLDGLLAQAAADPCGALQDPGDR